MLNRQAKFERKTSETDILVEVFLDGNGKYQVATGVGFFDHMLCLFAKHGALDLTVKAAGDTHIDDHHTVEDVGIALGQSIMPGSGGIRQGNFVCPVLSFSCKQPSYAEPVIPL